MDIKKIQEKLAVFATERDWGQYHTPKNLASALSVEASELLEIFQWKDDANCSKLSKKELKLVGEEMADVAIYLLRFADVMGLDLKEEIECKIALNEQKYSVSESKGNCEKYNRREK